MMSPGTSGVEEQDAERASGVPGRGAGMATMPSVGSDGELHTGEGRLLLEHDHPSLASADLLRRQPGR
jgi:hypothetical protein